MIEITKCHILKCAFFRTYIIEKKLIIYVFDSDNANKQNLMNKHNWQFESFMLNELKKVKQAKHNKYPGNL